MSPKNNEFWSSLSLSSSLNNLLESGLFAQMNRRIFGLAVFVCHQIQVDCHQAARSAIVRNGSMTINSMAKTPE